MSPRSGVAAEDAPVEVERVPNGKRIARIAVGPFGDEQIVADHQSRQHRARGDDERRDDEGCASSERDEEQEQEEAERRPTSSPSALRRLGARRRARGGGWRRRRRSIAPLSLGAAARSSAARHSPARRPKRRAPRWTRWTTPGAAIEAADARRWRELFAAEPDRLDAAGRSRKRGIRFDFSKTHLSRDARRRLPRRSPTGAGLAARARRAVRRRDRQPDRGPRRRA